jgi:mannosyl-3-phosphoglycerate phosphatase
MIYLFFSDLDGTLLDHETYGYEPAREALALIREKGYPLILVSSKTYHEMKILHEEMRLSAPFIFENGGGICWPEGGGRLEYLGMSASDLKERKGELEAAVGEPVEFITDMEAGEIARRTGLPLERALLAQKRTTSLPFVIPSGRTIGTGELSRINDEMRHNGLSVTRGGRFYHFLSARSNKGSAIEKVIQQYNKTVAGPLTSVGIGDSENDMAMFGVVDIPVLVRKVDGSVIQTGDARIMETAGIGPEGFNEAVTGIIGAQYK